MSDATQPGRNHDLGERRWRRRGRQLLPLLVLMLAFGAGGCRRAPAKPTLYYEKEEAAMMEALRAKKRAELEQYASDRYPWEGRRRPMDQLPDRLAATHARYKAEIEFLDLVVHGKKPGK